MLKKCAALLTGAAVLLGLAACGGVKPPDASESGKIKVYVTFDALREFTQAVGGDRVDVTVMVPEGMEPHEFEPKAKDMAGLGEARVFIYNGLGMEAWVEQTLAASGNKSLIVVDASKGAEPIANTDPAVAGEHGDYDPHLWLSLKGAQLEARNIRDGLAAAAPQDKAAFEQNYNDYAAQLEALYTEFAAKFQAVSNKDFVTGHAAFAYLCRDFGLLQMSVEDVFAEGEPTAQKLAALVEYCKTNQVKTIFAEKLASPAVSKTLADEVDARVRTIYTMESLEDGKTYLQRMRDNLTEILSSLSQ